MYPCVATKYMHTYSRHSKSNIGNSTPLATKQVRPLGNERVARLNYSRRHPADSLGRGCERAARMASHVSRDVIFSEAHMLLPVVATDSSGSGGFLSPSFLESTKTMCEFLLESFSSKEWRHAFRRSTFWRQKKHIF